MTETITFHLVAPESEVFAGEVESVTAPGSEGDFGVFKGHAPFMTTLREGTVSVMHGGKRQDFAIHGGFADVTPTQVTVLAEAVEREPAA